jgi:UDP-xylose/UDP-N-acetylglucosamine transporter B4
MSVVCCCCKHREDTGAGNTITFFQFLFISIEGLVFVSHFFTTKPSIPISKYAVMVTLYFIVSVLNNYSLIFDIPMPLHMIFRAGTLMANMILGILILHKRYPVSKYASVVMITIGISVATVASAQSMGNGEEVSEDTQTGGDGGWVVFKLLSGICFLLLALFLSAFMGIFQEKVYSSYGRHAREAMFYNVCGYLCLSSSLILCLLSTSIQHALPLPGFLLLAPGIWNKILTYSASAPVSLGPMSLPRMWLYLLANCLTQYVCIRGVFSLTTECPSLFVTLVVTLRKFVSLLFSIFYFRNPFTVQHWVATVMVFTGTLLFSGTLQSVGRTILGLGKKEKTS